MANGGRILCKGEEEEDLRHVRTGQTGDNVYLTHTTGTVVVLELRILSVHLVAQQARVGVSFVALFLTYNKKQLLGYRFDSSSSVGKPLQMGQHELNGLIQFDLGHGKTGHTRWEQMS